MSLKLRGAGVAAAAAFALVLAGCGGSSPNSASGGGGSGSFTFVSGKDTTGKLQTILDEWNKANPDTKVKFIELSAEADQQRNSMVQNFTAHSSAYDVLNVDVVWTAEFAAHQWLQSLPQSLGGSTLLPATVATATYNNKLYAAPFTSDGGMLYYRSDLVKTPPKTWAELIADCKIAKAHGMGCYAGQHAQYEGLTVNAAEAINGAGGTFLGKDGKTVTVDSPQARAGLSFLANGFKQGYIPKDAITYTEEEGRRAFQQGKLLFLRNWAYVYNLANTKGPDSKIVGKFKAAPLPGENGVGASSLGGHNLALSSYSKHKDAAEKFMAFMQSAQTQKELLLKLSLAPVNASLYDDQSLYKAAPFLPTLKQSILHAVPRPVTPNYNAVTLAIEKEAYAAEQGKKSVDQAITDLSNDLKQATSSG
jgi:multiple sugar transport system substrate-binding protein